MAIIRAGKGISVRRLAHPWRPSSYQADMFSTIFRISGKVQLRGSISKLLRGPA